jgi:hypothetical protein
MTSLSRATFALDFEQVFLGEMKWSRLWYWRNLMVVRWKVIPNVGINLLQNDCYLLGLERLQVGRDIERENRTCRMKKRTQAEVPYYHMPDIQLINCFRSIDLRSLLFVVCSQQGSALVKYGVGGQRSPQLVTMMALAPRNSYVKLSNIRCPPMLTVSTAQILNISEFGKSVTSIDSIFARHRESGLEQRSA